LRRVMEIPDRIFPAPLAAVDAAEIQVEPSVVRQRAPSEFELGARAIVIAKTMIGIYAFLHVHLASIGLDPFCLSQCGICPLAPLRSVIVGLPIEIEIHFAQETVSEQKIGIAPYRFLEQANGLEKALLATEIDVCLIVENSRACIKIVRDEIAR